MDIKACCFFGSEEMTLKHFSRIKNVFIREVLLAYELGYRVFISGYEPGFETFAAFELLEMKKYYPEIKLHIYLARTNTDEIHMRNNKLNKLIIAADLHRYIRHDDIDTAFNMRNKYILSKCDYCIAHGAMITNDVYVVYV